MIYPKNNRIIFWVFKRYVQRIVGKQFHELVFNTIEVDNSRSVLLIANHYSFWDALILFCINELSLKKKFHAMILEDTSKKEKFLKYAGAFSVAKNSRDVVKSLAYAAKLLEDPQNLVLMFPQGKLYSNFVNHIHFEKGVQHIIKQAGGNFQLVFAAAFIQYFQHKKQTATVYLKAVSENFAGKGINHLQSAYQQYYEASKLLQTEIVI
jgi:1-acyl-sn-glycerol-3-phosphate acyltransferase